MNPKGTMRRQFRANLVGAVIVVILLSFTITGIEIWRTGDILAKSLSRLYTENMVMGIEKGLSKDIEIIGLMAESDKMKQWLMNPHDTAGKQAMQKEVRSYQGIAAEKNFFLVSTLDQQIYFTELQSTDDWVASGALKTTNYVDSWYFNTVSDNNIYNLNVDLDRFLGKMRVWINYQVKMGDKVIGVIGTGTELSQVVKEVFEPIKNLGARTYIIDANGFIQLDSNELYDNTKAISRTDVTKLSIYTESASEPFREIIKNYMSNGHSEGSLVQVEPLAGQWNHYIAMASIDKTEWHVVTIFSIAGLLHPYQFLPILILVLLAILMLGFFIDRLVQHLILKPLSKVMLSMNQKSLNEEVILFGIERNDEIGQLVRGIQTMSDRLVSAVPVGLFLIDQNGQIIYANPYCLEQLGFNDVADLKDVFYNNPQRLFSNMNDYENIISLINSRQSIPTYELQLKNTDGRQFWVEFRLTKVPKSDENWHFEGILLNIQDKKDYEQQLMNMAIKDQLTGLYNRYYFEKVVAEEVKRCDRSDLPLSMIIFDLDHFKHVNDDYGHDIGDEVLKRVADKVKKGLRNSDKLVRWGGEEFAILLPDTNQFSAEIVAEKMRELIEQTLMPFEGNVTASFGIALRQPYEPFTDWFRRVDQALLQAKASGRNCVRVAEAIKERQQFSPVKLVWTEQFNSGHPVIDKEHQQLFSLANELIENGYKTETLGKAMGVYTEITQHIEMHLAHEEEILKAINYPEEALNHHKKIHKLLIEMMQMQSEALAVGKTKPSDVFLRLVEEVVFNHMLVEDLKFYSFIQKQTKFKSDDMERNEQ